MTFKNIVEMKSLYTKNILILITVITSMSCFVYLNTQTEQKEISPTTGQSIMLEEEEEQEDTDLALPDVRIIQHIFEAGSKLIPMGR